MFNMINKKNNIIFAHANGFPPKSYNCILNDFKKQYSIHNFLLRPLTKKYSKPHKIKDWNIFCEDLEKFILEKKLNNVIGMGHSIGGNILLDRAIHNKKLFSKLILLDPTLFPPKIIFFWKFINLLKLNEKFLNLSKLAKHKKMKYSSYDEIFENYRNKKIFKNINDEILSNYIYSITKKNIDNSIEIIYSNLWEKIIYDKGLLKDNFIWQNINGLKTPTLIIRANESTALPYSSIKKIKNKNKSIKIHTLKETSHLFPFEKPDEVLKIIKKFI